MPLPHASQWLAARSFFNVFMPRRYPGYSDIEVLAGIDLFGDYVEYQEVALVGHRLQKVLDYGYESNSECSARATGEVRKHVATAKRCELVTLPNVGLRLFYVVAVTDECGGVSSEVYRMRGIEQIYDATKPQLALRHTVTLGAW